MFNLQFQNRQTAQTGASIYQWALASAQHTLPERFNTPSKTPEERRLRFEAIAAFMALKLTQTPEVKNQKAAIEAMINDFDGALREAGISDLKVGKEIRAYAAAFNGRWQAYKQALSARNPAALEEALAHNHVAKGKELKALTTTLYAHYTAFTNTGDPTHEQTIPSKVSRSSKQGRS